MAVAPPVAPARRVPPAGSPAIVLGRVGPVLRRRPTLLWWGTAGACFLLYAALSVSRQENLLSSGYDLGIFDQAVRSYADGHLPYAALKGSAHYSVLGDHFSPILLLLVPFYWVCRSADTLLVAQAFLLAVAVVPLARWAHRELGIEAAAVVAFGYGSSWGIASAVGFDFHEVCFAVPLLAFSVEALAAGRWRAAVLWALPLVLVKEDLGATLAVIGLLVAWGGPRLLGLATAVFGLCASAVEVLVLIPMADTSGAGYAYWAKSAGVTTPVHYSLVHRLEAIPYHLFFPHAKLETLIALLAPTAFLALRSRLALIAVPTLIWRFESWTGAYWGTSFHYSADLMPIVFAALIDALAAGRRRGWSARSIRVALAVSLAVSGFMVSRHAFSALMDGSTWQVSAQATAARRIASLVPDGATVAADNQLAPQLTDRTTVFLFPNYPDPGLPTAQYLIADPADPATWPDRPSVYERDLALARAHGYRRIASDDGYILLELTPHQ
jgi:uncharacterized membrane protein